MKIRMADERIARNWTQAYVAKQVGISRAAYCLLEQGQRKPSYEVLVKLEDLFELSHRVLFTHSK